MFMFASAFATVSALNIDSFGRDNNQVYLRELHWDGMIVTLPILQVSHRYGNKEQMLQDCCEDVK